MTNEEKNQVLLGACVIHVVMALLVCATITAWHFDWLHGFAAGMLCAVFAYIAGLTAGLARAA